MNIAKEAEQEFREIVASVSTPAQARKLAAQLRSNVQNMLRVKATIERTYRNGYAMFDRMEAGLLPVLSEPDQQRLRALLERIVTETRPNL
jgi:hypothetical protein